MGLDLNRLEELEKAATPAEWFRGATDMTRHTIGTLLEEVARLGFEYGDDADFIVALRNCAPALIAEVKAAREWLWKETFIRGCNPLHFNMGRLHAENDGLREAYRKLVEQNTREVDP